MIERPILHRDHNDVIERRYFGDGTRVVCVLASKCDTTRHSSRTEYEITAIDSILHFVNITRQGLSSINDPLPRADDRVTRAVAAGQV